MGSKIEAVDVAFPGLFRRGSISMETRAAKGCLRKAGVDPNDVGLLINAGIYRDDHIGEPAIAAFLQRKVGINEEFKGGKYSFSFDLSHGGCGMLTALMVLDGFITSGVAARGMVVAGDTEPVPGESMGYEFSSAAAAVLITAGRHDEGFRCFRSYTNSRYIDLFCGRIEWQEEKKRNRLIIREETAYRDACVEWADDALREFRKEMSLDLDDIHLVISSQSPPGFVSHFGERTGLTNRMVDATAECGNVHTAGVGVALNRSIEEGKFLAAVNILFLTVGAGITASLALYRNRR